MLILLPPSEGKTPGRRGARPVDLDALWCGSELGLARREVLDAVAEVSLLPDALTRLKVPPTLLAEVERNTTLAQAPCRPASEVYTGVLFQALDLTGLDPAARRRAHRSVLVQSALFGAVRPQDRIPAYRLSMGVSLPGPGGLAAFWRRRLTEPLGAAAGDGLVVDCRSSDYVAAWRPSGATAERWARIVMPGASHWAKHTRGLVAGHLLRSGARPRTVPQLAELLSEAFTVRATPDPRGRGWEVAVGVTG